MAADHEEKAEKLRERAETEAERANRHAERADEVQPDRN